MVRPYAILTGPYGYVAGGAALRDQGYGSINLTWPGAPSTANLVGAYMIWSIMNDSTPPSYGTLNGVNVTGTWTAYATPSPCWSPTYIYTFVADVTSLINNGVNTLTDFPSSITTGVNPWANPGGQTSLLDDGVSLVAIFNSGSSTIQQVTVYSGAFTDGGGPLSAQLNYSTTDSASAKTTFMISDGQLPGNEAVWNGATLEVNAFTGGDPKETSTPWSYGNLSDTKTYNVSVASGSDNTTAAIDSTEGDCLTWIGQVLSVQVAASPGPYPVTFTEQGLLSGMTWTVTTNHTGQTGTVTASGSSIVFLLGNGTYPYTITPVPGFSAPYKGTFTVAGGAVFIRVPFHQALYPITFSETGLPLSLVWWAKIANTTLGISDNVSMFAPNDVIFAVPNGTFAFFVGDYSLYLPSPPKGSVTIASHGESVAIAFSPPPLFNVTFEEHGLLPGTTWGGSVYSNFGDYTNSTSAKSFTLPLPNASAFTDHIYPTAVTGYSVFGYLGFGVFAAPETVDVNYTALFAVNLTETGLPSGTYWSANLSGVSGTSYGRSSSPTLTFSAANGSYTFAVTHVWGYIADPVTGPVTVVGVAVSIPIVFTTSPSYPINFTETGLPAGTSWSVTLDLPNGTAVVLSSTTSTISVEEANGTFYYSVLAVKGFSAAPSFGGFVLSGAPALESIVFTQIFSVVFTETGLPSGYDWYLYFGVQYMASTEPWIVFSDPNGTYSFTVYTVSGFVPTPASGSITVDGANVTQPIVYTSPTTPTYPVTFTETGLPTGTNWSASLDYFTLWSTGTSMEFWEPNGSWGFTAPDAGGYSATPSVGTVTVLGGPVTQPLSYSIVAYSVTFEEFGLAEEASWSVNLAGTPQSSTSDTIVFSEDDGSYSFSASAAGYTALPATGDVVVSGEDAYQEISFTAGAPQTFQATFTESGLPEGTGWWVNLTEGPSLESVLTTATTPLANGSYSFLVSTTDKVYSAAGGEFSVEGSDVSISVPFSAVVFTVTFTETGLPTGSTWWVNVTGEPSLKVVESASVTLTLSNGSYGYTASAANRSYSAPGGTVHVLGADVPVTVPFGLAKAGAPAGFLGLPGMEGDWLVLGALLAALLACIFFVVARRKRREDEPDTPPKPPVSGGSSPPPVG